MLTLALYFFHLAFSVLATDGNFSVSYIGCYQDHRRNRILDGLSDISNLPNPIHSRSNMTIPFCAQSCYSLNFTFTGLESSTQCFCGSQLPILSLPNSACNMTCSGNPSQICGDRLKLSVYQMIEFHEPLATAPSPFSPLSSSEGVDSNIPSPSRSSSSGGSNAPVVALIVAGTSGAAILGLGMLMIVWRRRQSQKRMQDVPSSPVVDPQIRRSYRGTLERASSLAYSRMKYELRTPPPIYMSMSTYEQNNYSGGRAGSSGSGSGSGGVAEVSTAAGGDSFKLLPDSRDGGYTASWVDPRFPNSRFGSTTSLVVPSVYSRVDSIEDFRDYTPRLFVRHVGNEPNEDQVT